MKTFTINAGFVNMLNARLEKFQRKFNKFGNGSMSVTFSDERFVSDKQDKFYGQIVVDVTVDAQYKVNGYTFVASLEYDNISGQNIIMKMSEDVVVPASYRTRCECDHCKQNRARVYTVLLHNPDTDDYVQVGKSCLRDYLGCDVGDYVSWLSFFKNVEEYIEKKLHTPHSDSYRSAFEVEDVLQQTAVDVRLHGYTSRKQSFDYDKLSTASKVFQMMNGINKLHKYDVVEDCDKEYVQKVLHYINDADDTDNDYLHNLKIIVNHKYVENDKLGMLVSAVGCYIHEQNKEKQRTTTQGVQSTYVGNIGEKIEVPNTTVVCVASVDTMYGLLYIYTFKDEIGNVFVWRTSKGLDCDTPANIKGTIKGHTQYNGVKQTELTRCRIG